MKALYFSPESLLVPALLGGRAILTVHDLTPLSNPDLHARRTIWFTRTLLRVALRRVKAVVVPTEAVRQDIEVAFPGLRTPVVVAHEAHRPPEPPVLAPRAADPASPYCLYVGTIEPRKNVADLCRAFCQSAPAGWRLVLAGKVGWLSASQRDEFDELVLDDRIEYLGFVSDEQLDRLYRDASAFAYVPTAEGFGLPVLEAMAYGVPVIHSDDRALVEVSGGHAKVVPVASIAEALPSAFAHLLHDERERQRLSAEGLRRADEFSWHATANRIAQAMTGG